MQNACAALVYVRLPGNKCACNLVIIDSYRKSGFTLLVRREKMKKINGVKYSIFGVCVKLNLSDSFLPLVMSGAL